VASPVNTVCLDAVVVPESGANFVSGKSKIICSGNKPIVSHIICVRIVPSP
jgi:hypothetical protein